MQKVYQTREDIMNDMNLHYGYVHFAFPWRWIRDKQIVLQGNKWKGMLLILDSDDNVIKVYGYELVSEE